MLLKSTLYVPFKVHRINLITRNIISGMLWFRKSLKWVKWCWLRPSHSRHTVSWQSGRPTGLLHCPHIVSCCQHSLSLSPSLCYFSTLMLHSLNKLGFFSHTQSHGVYETTIQCKLLLQLGLKMKGEVDE